MYYQGGESQGNCFCYATDDLWANQPFTTCKIGDWYIFEQSVQPSAFARRQHKARLDLLDRSKNAYCPDGLTACNLFDQSRDGYECIDTTLDPESCGGCIHGEYGALTETTAEVDCTAISGTTLSHVACNMGKCVLSGCGEGYDLVDQSCVIAKK
ncbi:hypothetical protein I302_105350 [Kwoniella bestiolae CBS 10118]|uniref:Protein CPL1-like domain-containing protein n=1 Tax=Kwoniella bestiolae CBS 10118 TaxID=1296100 RepID=A0AAJ8K972_9TREE